MKKNHYSGACDVGIFIMKKIKKVLHNISSLH